MAEWLNAFLHGLIRWGALTEAELDAVMEALNKEARELRQHQRDSPSKDIKDLLSELGI